MAIKDQDPVRAIDNFTKRLYTRSYLLGPTSWADPLCGHVLVYR